MFALTEHSVPGLRNGQPRATTASCAVGRVAGELGELEKPAGGGDAADDGDYEGTSELSDGVVDCGADSGQVGASP